MHSFLRLFITHRQMYRYAIMPHKMNIFSLFFSWFWQHQISIIFFLFNLILYYGKSCFLNLLVIQVWDLATFQCIQTLTDHTSVVMSVLCWDQFLLSCSLDKTIKVSFSLYAIPIYLLKTLYFALHSFLIAHLGGHWCFRDAIMFFCAGLGNNRKWKPRSNIFSHWRACKHLTSYKITLDELVG